MEIHIHIILADVTVTVNGDFGTISYECYNHGYMGGENNLSLQCRL